MSKKAVLLVNLGSPDSTKVSDVRRYLREFLSDPRVLDAPAPIRWMVLNIFILPFRPKQSAEAYSSIWTDAGSPLIVTSYKQRELLESKVDVPVELAMRYGQPEIPATVEKMINEGVEELLLFPLYPHYAMSSYETVVVKVMEEVQARKPDLKVEIVQPFYNDPEYIDCLTESAKPYLEEDFDKLLFSFHGVPERHLRKSDPSHAHCLSRPDCCQLCHPAHATCYRHQCVKTVELFVEKTGLEPDRYFTSFQSRLGKDPWLTPYTDQTLERFGEEGVKKVFVICPAFITDCLETLEEIAEEGKETFIEAGGEDLKLIPCLNTHADWVEYMRRKVEAWQAAPVSVS